MKLIFSFLFGCFSLFGLAQDTVQLTLSEVIQIAVQNNYDIEIAANNQETARYNRNIGNAGMLPTVDLLGGLNVSSSNINQSFSNGTNISQNAVRADAYNASVELNWVLFDGLKMFATYDRLTRLKEQGEISTRISIEQTVNEVMLAYYQMVQQQQLITSANKNIEIYTERLRIAEAKLAAGTTSKVDVLQAKIDLNTQKSSVFTYQANLDNARIALNVLMGRDVLTLFSVNDSIALEDPGTLNGLLTTAVAQNNSLQLQESNIDVYRFIKREVNATRMPSLSFKTSYVFARSENQAGFSLFNQNLGFNVGLSVNYRLFNGWKNNTAYRAAKIGETNARLQYDLTELQVQQDIALAFNNYQTGLRKVELEKESLTLAEENVAIALERFRLGQSSSLEIQEALRSLEAAQIRLTDALFSAKSLEIQLTLLRGGLVRNR